MASEALAAALDRESVRAPVNVAVALRVETGTNGMGLRWARRGTFRVVAYAEGGWCEQRHVEGIGWCLFPHDEDIPADEMRLLLVTLSLKE